MADSQFFMLPKELWGSVLPRFVPLGDLGRLFRSCKALSTFLTNDDFWRFVGALRFHMGDAGSWAVFFFFLNVFRATVKEPKFN
jgi:hypothetical protein